MASVQLLIHVCGSNIITSILRSGFGFILTLPVYFVNKIESLEYHV